MLNQQRVMTLVVDGEHRITLSGGNATRIFDLDH